MRPVWPFGGTRQTSPDEPDLLDPQAWEGAGDDAGDAASDDPLAALNLDDEGQQRVSQFVQARETAYVSQLRQQLQQNGWDLNAEGRPVILNPHKVGEALGAAPPAASTPPAAVSPPALLAWEPEEVDMPDPYANPREYRQWVRDQAKAAVDDLKQEMLQQVGGVRNLVVGGLAGEALQIVGPALEQIGYGHIAAAPKFAEYFQQALKGVDPQHWRDPGTLARLAMMVIPDLAEDGGIPTPQQQQRPVVSSRDQQGRFAPASAPTPQQQAFSDLARQGLSLMSPSQSAGAPRERGPQDPDIARFAQLEGISYAEAEALANDKLTNHEYAAMRAKAAGQRGNSR